MTKSNCAGNLKSRLRGERHYACAIFSVPLFVSHFLDSSPGRVIYLLRFIILLSHTLPD
jgi:hypothetical protein